VKLHVNVLGLALVAGASSLGCQKCGGAQGSSFDAQPGSAEASAAPSASAQVAAEFPEIRDTGRGRATAALRAALGAYGVAYDAATLERECKVDDEGASIDDLEDVANKYGLEVKQVILPEEHVLSPEAKMLPAIVLADGPDDTVEFVLAWRLDGDRVAVMDPGEGRTQIGRADLEARLFVHEQTMAAEAFRAAMGTQSFQDALRARMEALGVGHEQAVALITRAAADRSVRGLGALDAAIRWLASEPTRAGGDAAERLLAAFNCAFEKKCQGIEAIPKELWSVQAAPKGEVLVQGAVILAIAGKRTP